MGMSILSKRLDTTDAPRLPRSSASARHRQCRTSGESAGILQPGRPVGRPDQVPHEFGQGMSATRADRQHVPDARQRRRADAAHPRRGLRAGGRHRHRTSEAAGDPGGLGRRRRNTTVQMMETVVTKATAQEAAAFPATGSPRRPAPPRPDGHGGYRPSYSCPSWASPRWTTRSTPFRDPRKPDTITSSAAAARLPRDHEAGHQDLPGRSRRRLLRLTTRRTTESEQRDGPDSSGPATRASRPPSSRPTRRGVRPRIPGRSTVSRSPASR